MNIDLIADVIAWTIFVGSGVSAAALLAFLTHRFCLQWERRTSEGPSQERQSLWNGVGFDRHRDSTLTVSRKKGTNRR